MKNKLLCLLFVLLLINCNKENNLNFLNGKIKTIKWYDPSDNLLASYFFSYDTTGNLLSVYNDTNLYLTFSDLTSTSIRMNYFENSHGVYKHVYFDVNNKVTSIFVYDTITHSDLGDSYLFNYNGVLLDSVYESFQPFPAFPLSEAPKNKNFVFDGNNYTQFQSVWGGKYPPITGSYYLYNDTIKYVFTDINNDGLVPMQFPLRTYKWNSQNETENPRGSNILYMLGIKGIGLKMNKNLIRSIEISGSQIYRIDYEYEVNSNGQIIEMRIIDNEYGFPEIYTFKMTYYE